MSEQARRSILARRARFVAAALASAGFAPGCGDARAPHRVTVTPSAPSDRDGDGIADAFDKCPDDPEDRDNFEDDDGCPDPDNDQDGVLDNDDKCPNVPGDIGNAGCPKACLNVVPYSEIKIHPKVFFQAGKAAIRAVSVPILEEIALLLKARPTMRVEIEGHADQKESQAQPLSKLRAEGVKAWLVAKGVGGDRLVIVAFGASQPLGDPSTEEGRAQNRRVSFKVLEP